MEFCDARIAVSMFAILMTIANVRTGVGFAVSGTMVDAIGYRRTFVPSRSAATTSTTRSNSVNLSKK